ncbi:hypothetical protein MTO96_038883 [Rhipicephalus appendiculatus]
MASADPPLTRREAERILKHGGRAAPARAPSTAISSVVQPGRLFSAVVSPPATVPSAPDSEVQKDMVIGALVAAVRALIGTLPQAGPVPYCIDCGDSETLDHLLLECPAGDVSRQVMLAVYGELGLPRATSQNLLFPACRREHIKRALSALLGFVDGSGLRERI